jgi:hypothetical protein
MEGVGEGSEMGEEGDEGGGRSRERDSEWWVEGGEEHGVKEDGYCE